MHEAVAHASATNAHAPAAVHSTANQAWGLPTQLCPASPFLLKGYPESHSQWRAQGRVLYGCTTAGALGNSLRVLPTLFLIAIFLDLALVLDDSACANVSLLENGHAVDPVSKHATFRRLLPRSFRGPHFDWSTSAADSAAPLAMDVKAFIGFRAQSANAPTAAKPAYIAGYRYGWPLRVVAHPADMTHRLLKGNLKLRTKVLGLLGPLGRWYVSNASSKWSRKLSIDTRLDGCLLRYLLAPRPHLLSRLDELVQTSKSKQLVWLPLKTQAVHVDHTRMRGGGNPPPHKHAPPYVHAPPHMHAPPQHPPAPPSPPLPSPPLPSPPLPPPPLPPPPPGLLHVVSLYVRLGDHTMAGVNSSWSVAFYPASRASIHPVPWPFLEAPSSVFRCLDRLASLPASLPATACPSHGRKSSPKGHIQGSASSSSRAACASRVPPLQLAVVGDSPDLITCAHRSIGEQRVFSPPGVPVHLVGSDPKLTDEAINLDKVVLDWLLLARSQGLLTVGGTRGSFFHSARLFRDASHSGGWSIDLATRSHLRACLSLSGATSALSLPQIP